MAAKRYDIAIVGAGVAGLTLARLLERKSGTALSTVVIESAGPPPPFDANNVGLRVSAVSPRSTMVFLECDVWSSIVERRAARFSSMRVWDSASRWDSNDAVCFRAREFGADVLGYIVENDLIRRVLVDSLAEADLPVGTGMRLRSLNFNPHSVELTLADGQRVDARLVVGADGSQSAVRRLAAIHATEWDYRQRAFVAHVRTKKPHADTAWQRFTDDGPIALLPLGDGRCSIVYSTQPARASHLVELDERALNLELTAVSGGVLGDIHADSARASFPLAAAHALAYAAERCVLVGDAAHRVHPLAGQGVNLGIADAAALATVVTDALAAGRDPGDLSVLRVYERARRAENELTLRSLDALHRLFAVRAEPVIRLRRAGMRMFDGSKAVKRRAARQAMGLVGKNS